MAQRLSVDQQQLRNDETTESRIDISASLADVTCLSLGALAELDDVQLAATMQRLLPSFEAIGNRVWGQESSEGSG